MRAEVIAKLAVSKDGYIGNSQNPPIYLPWPPGALPGDLKRFKQDTLNYPIVMGRITAQSLGKPLPERPNVFVTAQDEWEAPKGFIKARSLAQAIHKYEFVKDKIFIIGGAKLLHEAFYEDIVDKLILTETYREYSGDVKFPKIDWSKWEEIERELFPNFGYDIVTYKRRRT